MARAAHHRFWSASACARKRTLPFAARVPSQAADRPPGGRDVGGHGFQAGLHCGCYDRAKRPGSAIARHCPRCGAPTQIRPTQNRGAIMCSIFISLWSKARSRELKGFLRARRWSTGAGSRRPIGREGEASSDLFEADDARRDAVEISGPWERRDPEAERNRWTVSSPEPKRAEW